MKKESYENLFIVLSVKIVVLVVIIILCIIAMLNYEKEKCKEENNIEFQDSFEEIYKNIPISKFEPNCKIILMINSTAEVWNDEEHSESYIKICEVLK